MVKPVIQIGLLNFTLFKDAPEFYATYQMRNSRTNQLYSDKLQISVLDLSRIDLATKQDQLYQLDTWAKLFNAITWEDIRMLAEKNNYIAQAASTIYELSEEEKIRLQCQAREDFLRTQRDREYYQSLREEKIAQQETILNKQKAELSKQEKELNELRQQVAQLNYELEKLRQQ